MSESLKNKEVSVSVQKFAEFLFEQQNPQPNTLDIDKTFNTDKEFCDFLYELFFYGYNKKYKNTPLNSITENHFNELRKYINAVGADVRLLGYKKNTNGEVQDVEIGFQPFYSK